MTQTPRLPHILVVDDDPAVLTMLKAYLTGYDFTCSTVETGPEMHRAMAQHQIDLVILDVRLKGEDGMQLLKVLREESTIPILMLTGRQEEADRVMGLELGADDYITKPFSPRELLARIRALLRRAQAQVNIIRELSKARAYRFAGWELRIGLRRLFDPSGQMIELTNGEFSLLAAFVCAPGRILTREQLQDMSRLHNAEIYDRSIDVQILRLRKKIEVDRSRPALIVTQRGLGYIFDTAVEVVH